MPKCDYPLYPLHPGQTHAEPYYCTIPLEEYEALKKRVRELEEERRWRKFSDEKPELGDIVLVKLSERVKGHYFPMDVVRWDSSYELGEIEVSHWMPLPKFEEK